MVHLPPLPGSPRAWTLDRVWDHAAKDAEALVRAGFTGVMVENFGDVPFLAGRVAPITTAAMAVITSRLRREVLGDGVFFGVNVLRNDAESALGIAAVCEAQAVRINVHQGARVTDQGVIVGDAGVWARTRVAWRAEDVACFCDVDVKHSAPLGTRRPLAAETHDLVERGLADAVIVSGEGTGAPVDLDRLSIVADAAGTCPVYVGSGATLQMLPTLLGLVHGVIVGTALKVGGRVGAAVDGERARAFVDAVGGGG